MSRATNLSDFLTRLTATASDLDEIEILDCLWLTAKLYGPATAADEEIVERKIPREVPPPITTSRKTDLSRPPPIDQTRDPSSRGEATRGTEGEITLGGLPAVAVDPSPERGARIGLQEVNPLPDALKLVRALRPLRRRSASRSRSVLDEEATVEESARRKRRTPQMRPWRERWLDLALLIDVNPSMLAWQPTVRAFRRLCETLGPFRDVRTWLFDTAGSKAALLTVQGRSIRQARELLDPAGRRAVVIISDCLGQAWANGGVATVIAEWQRHLPVSILQLFPQSFWRQSALADAPIIRVKGRAGVPNARLDRLPLSYRVPVPAGGIAVPLLGLEADALAAWAELLAGKPDPAAPAVILTPGQATAAVAWRGGIAGNRPPSERAAQFKNRASSLGYRLAFLLASAWPLRLPLMRLVQETMLPESRQIHLAEVLHSGLLTRKIARNGPASFTEETVEFQWDPPEMREYLLNHCPVSQAVEVHRRVSQYVAEHMNIHSQFEAILRNPEKADIVVPADAAPIATLGESILRRLGGPYTRAAARVAAAIASPGTITPPPPEPEPFLPIERLREFVTRTKAGRESGPVTGELLIFDTPAQRTWLVATHRYIFILLDMEETRQSGRVKQKYFSKERLYPLKFSRNDFHGIVYFSGPRDGWFYSHRLFPEPEALEAAIEGLVARRSPQEQTLDWRGKRMACLLETPDAQSADWIEALERTGATVSVDGHADSFYERLGSQSYDAVIVGGMVSAARTSLHLLGRLRKLGFRTPFIFLGKRITPRDRKALMKEGARACTEDFGVLMQTLATHFAKPPGRYAGRRLLWQANPTPESTRFCYGLAAEGIHFHLDLREKLSFGLEPDDKAFDVIVVRNAKLIPRRPGDVVAPVPRQAIGPGTKFILFGVSSPGQRSMANAAGALVVREDHQVLHNVLDCCALARFEGYLGDQQAARFVEWATPRHSPTTIETLLRVAGAAQCRQLWAKCKSTAELCRTAVEILTAVFDSRRADIWRGARGEDQVQVAENKNVKAPPIRKREAAPVSAKSAGIRSGVESAQGMVTSFPIFGGGTSGESVEWGRLQLGPMDGEVYTQRQEEWVAGIVKSLGEAIAALEGTGPTRSGIPEIVFKRGVAFLQKRSRSRTRLEAEHLIGTPDSLEWIKLYEGFATETGLLAELLALLAAMWQPERYELWAVIDRELRLISGSSPDISEPDPVVTVAKGTGRVEEFSGPLQPAFGRERSRLGIPIRIEERALPLGFIGLIHTLPNVFRGAAVWIQKLFSTGLEMLRRMERLGGIEAEQRLSPEQRQLLRYHYSRSATAVVLYRATRRALPLPLLADQPRSAEFNTTMSRVEYLHVYVTRKPENISVPGYARALDLESLETAVEKARPSLLGSFLEHPTADSLMLMGEAVAAQGVLCLVRPEAWQLRNFFFLCDALSKLAAAPRLDRFTPSLWGERFRIMLQSDLRPVVKLQKPLRLEKFGVLWQELDKDTPWSLSFRGEGMNSPERKVFVAGLAGAVLGNETADACQRVGRSLARLGYGLIVGSYSEVDTLVAQSFVEALPRQSKLSNYLTQLVKHERPSKMDGRNILFVSSGQATSQELYNDAAAVILINGADKAAQLATGAATLSIPVLPLPGTGGAARTHYETQLHSAQPLHRDSLFARYPLLNEEIPVAVDLLFHILRRLEDRSA